MQGEDSASDTRVIAAATKVADKRTKKEKTKSNSDEPRPSLDDADVEKDAVDQIAQLDDADFISDEEREKLRSKYLLHRFWQTARGFWRRGSDPLACVVAHGPLGPLPLYLA